MVDRNIIVKKKHKYHIIIQFWYAHTRLAETFTHQNPSSREHVVQVHFAFIVSLFNNFTFPYKIQSTYYLNRIRKICFNILADDMVLTLMRRKNSDLFRACHLPVELLNNNVIPELLNNI